MRRDDVPLSAAPLNDRPHDRFHCGSVCGDGARRPQNCPLGPTRSGKCRHEKELCVPVRTFRYWSRLVKLAVLLVGIGSIAAFACIDRATIFKPGPLSASHAQILSVQVKADSCLACHEQAASPLGWFLAGHSVDQVTQSERCMDCHHSRLPRDRFRTAHQFTESQLLSLQHKPSDDVSLSLAHWATSATVAQNDVACSTCHREHGGESNRLTSMSNTQCQSCHSSRFTSFAVDHPDWGQWPYDQVNAISFNHASHSMRHFPAKLDESGQATRFLCSQCHPASDRGDFVRTTHYEAACAACHDASLKQQSSNRIDLFVLPSLASPSPSLQASWPATATGYYDGKVGPLARLLLERSGELKAALDALPAGGDITQVNAQDAAQRQAAETIAIAIRDQIHSIASQGTVNSIAGLGSNELPVRTMLRDLSPQLLLAAQDRWFSGLAISSQTADSPFRTASARTVDDDDDLLSEPTVAPERRAASSQHGGGNRRPERYDPLQSQPDGGWYIDDIRLAVAYRGNGHADSVLKAALELAAGLPNEHPSRKELISAAPVAACVSCHQMPASSGPIQWQADKVTSFGAAQLTKFTHRPHMNLPSLMDCSGCHTINESAMTPIKTTAAVTAAVNETDVSVCDFNKLETAQCAKCHTSQAAGDACIKCHRYHPPAIDLGLK